MSITMFLKPSVSLEPQSYSIYFTLDSEKQQLRSGELLTFRLEKLSKTLYDTSKIVSQLKAHVYEPITMEIPTTQKIVVPT